MRARQRSWTTPGTLSISRGGAGFRRGGRWGRSRRRLWTAWVTALVLAISFLPATVWPATAPRAKAATTCGAGCHVTVNGLDFSSGAALTSFNFIVNVDNSKLPSDPLSLSTESNSPIVATGDQDHRTVTLPEGRYLISMRSLDHKMWGNYITLPGDADASGTLTVNMELTTQSADNPLPLGKIRVFVFNDNAWTNGAPDTEEAGLGGFQVGLEEQTGSAVTVDYNNNPLCGGICKTSSAAGDARLRRDQQPRSGDVFHRRAPAADRLQSGHTRKSLVPDHDDRRRATTDGADRRGRRRHRCARRAAVGAPEHPHRLLVRLRVLAAPVRRTERYRRDHRHGTQLGGVGPVHDRHLHRPGREPVRGAVGRLDRPDRLRRPGRRSRQLRHPERPARRLQPGRLGRAAQLHHAVQARARRGGPDRRRQRDRTTTAASGSASRAGSAGSTARSTRTRTATASTTTGIDTPIPNTDMDQRWRDGSIKESTFTDPNGDYVYPTAEGGALGRWFINEQGFARFSADPGASVHDERTGAVTPSCLVDGRRRSTRASRTRRAAACSMNQALLEGHRATVDWGKRDYPAGTPGQIVGITYFATTRNEFDARFQAHEDYEAGDPGRDRLPRDARARRRSQHRRRRHRQRVRHRPLAAAQREPGPAGSGGNSFTQSCNPIRDFAGTDITNQLNPDIGPNCLEVPLTGAADEGRRVRRRLRLRDYCPDGYDLDADDGDVHRRERPRPPRGGRLHRPRDHADGRHRHRAPATPAPAESQRVTDAARRRVPGGGNGCLYRIVREEDVNVDLGNQFAPQIPPPPCNGDDHVIDQATLTPRSNFFPVAGAARAAVRQAPGRAQEPAERERRLLHDDQLPDRPERGGPERHPDRRRRGARSRGRPGLQRHLLRAQPDVATGTASRGRSRTSRSGSTPGSTPSARTAGLTARPQTSTRRSTRNNWRLIKTVNTSADGAYEALLPSTETLNCPIPQGPCPGMYIAIVDDPGTKAHPNANYNPNLLTANTPFEVWPGLTTQLDTPVDPISGTACQDPAGAAGGTRPIRRIPPGPSCCRSPRRCVGPTRAAVRSRSRPTSSASRVRPARPAAGSR